MPRGDGPFPLALIVHGNHSMEDYSDPGYAYLGELLASRGIIMASVDENFINGIIPGLPDAQVLEQQPAAGVVFLSDAAVDEVLVHRNEDVAAAREQLAEVSVAGVRVRVHAVVAVDDEHERKRTVAGRVPNTPLQRQFVAIKSPEVLALVARPAAPGGEERAAVDCLGNQLGVAAEFGPPNVRAAML